MHTPSPHSASLLLQDRLWQSELHHNYTRPSLSNHLNFIDSIVYYYGNKHKLLEGHKENGNKSWFSRLFLWHADPWKLLGENQKCNKKDRTQKSQTKKGICLWLWWGYLYSLLCSAINFLSDFGCKLGLPLTH